MNKFSLGTLVGISSLVLVPLLASAASSASGTSANPSRERPIPSQECLQALVAKQDMMLDTFDVTSVARKSAMQTHRDALSAAAAITDEAQRQVAVQQANQDFRTAMQDLKPENSTEMEAAREAVHDACGGAMGSQNGMGLGMGGGFGGGHMMGEFRGHGMRGQHRDCPFGAEASDE